MNNEMCHSYFISIIEMTYLSKEFNKKITFSAWNPAFICTSHPSRNKYKSVY